MLKRLREHAEAVFSAGLKAVDPIRAVGRHVKRDGDVLTVGERSCDLSKFERVFVVGAGKASAAMGRAVKRSWAKGSRPGSSTSNTGMRSPWKPYA
jgi:hydroxypyruvate reductase